MSPERCENGPAVPSDPLDEAIRGFFIERGMGFEAADVWTEQVMNIVKEHRV